MSKIKNWHSRFHHNAKTRTFTSSRPRRRLRSWRDHAQFCMNHDFTSGRSRRPPVNVHCLKGHCHDKAHVRSWLTLFFGLANRNLNTITSATNSPGVSRAFRKYSSAGFWVFVCKEYSLCLAVWRPCPSYFLSTCIHICSYIKFPIFVFLSFLPSWPNEVAFVSSRFENPLSIISYFRDSFKLKKQNMPFK